MTARYADHILGPDTHANRPAAADVPDHAQYRCTDHNKTYLNDAGTWIDYQANSAGAVASVVAGTNVTVDNTDPANPIVSASGGGGGATWTSAINDPLSSTAGLLTALSGTWGINAGVLRQSNASGDALRAHATTVTPTAMRAVECEMAYISGSGTRRMGLNVSWKNVINGNLYVYAESTNGTTWTVKVEDAGVVLLYTSATISYAGSGYLRLGVIQVGTMIDIYLGGVWLDSLNTVGSNQWQTGKYVGLSTTNAVVDFRNLKAWSFAPSPF